MYFIQSQRSITRGGGGWGYYKKKEVYNELFIGYTIYGKNVNVPNIGLDYNIAIHRFSFQKHI